MNTLLLDSSNVNLVVGVAIDNKIVYQKIYACWQRQSEKMIPEIELAIKETGIELLDIDEVVCGKGPGSYTGVRIALTIAKIICLMNGAKLKLVSSLQMFGNKDKSFISLINARSNRSYIGAYSPSGTILQDCVLTNEEVLEFINNHSDFEVIGDCKYLKIESSIPNEIEGMMSIKDSIIEVEDILSVKPTYLKD